VHVDLAIEILKAILSETSRESGHHFLYNELMENLGEIRKAYISFLSKLTLTEPEEVDEWKIKALQTLILAIPTVSCFPH
jgi:hypothetical protein